MSLDACRIALEEHLKALAPPLPTQWENGKVYVPQKGVAYQKAHLMPVAPDNPEMGGGYIERGLFQVTLMYPLLKGTADITARAKLIRAHFPRARSLVAGGLVTSITYTPQIAPGMPVDDRYAMAVTIEYFAQIAA